MGGATAGTGGSEGAARSRRAPKRGARADLVLRVGWVPFACVIGALMLVAGSAVVWNASPYWGRNGDQVRVGAIGSVPHSRLSAKVGAAPQHIWPDRIRIPKLDAVAPVVKVGTNAQDELDIPIDPKVVGWWSPGARPGARKGTAVLAGHINYSGVTGTLSAIGTLRPGDRVLIFGRDHHHSRRLTFRVTGVRTYHKTHLPYQKIFDQDVAGRLALVTCGGPFDAATGNYLDNIVAYAVPTGHRVRPLTP